jgi:hypothetical protein
MKLRGCSRRTWILEEYPSNLHHKEDNEITIHPEDAEFINITINAHFYNTIDFINIGGVLLLSLNVLVYSNNVTS